VRRLLVHTHRQCLEFPGWPASSAARSSHSLLQQAAFTACAQMLLKDGSCCGIQSLPHGLGTPAFNSLYSNMLLLNFSVVNSLRTGSQVPSLVNLVPIPTTQHKLDPQTSAAELLVICSLLCHLNLLAAERAYTCLVGAVVTSSWPW
jgi:hypothetical protein